MIVQHDAGQPNQAISVDSANHSTLVVAPFPFLDKQCAGAQFDLTPFQGGPVRLYLEMDGSLNTEPFRDHFWLLAEAILPERKFDNQSTGQVDENGQPLYQMVEISLDLNEVSITAYSLPEVTTV